MSPMDLLKWFFSAVVGLLTIWSVGMLFVNGAGEVHRRIGGRPVAWPVSFFLAMLGLGLFVPVLVYLGTRGYVTGSQSVLKDSPGTFSGMDERCEAFCDLLDNPFAKPGRRGSLKADSSETVAA